MCFDFKISRFPSFIFPIFKHPIIGGIGLATSIIRAKDSYIRGTNGVSNGLIPMLRYILSLLFDFKTKPLVSLEFSTTQPDTSTKAAGNARVPSPSTSSPGMPTSTSSSSSGRTTAKRKTAPETSSQLSGSLISSWSEWKLMQIGPSCVPMNARDCQRSGVRNSTNSTPNTSRRNAAAKPSRQETSSSR